jgi:hypothetical protein
MVKSDKQKGKVEIKKKKRKKKTTGLDNYYHGF